MTKAKKTPKRGAPRKIRGKAIERIAELARQGHTQEAIAIFLEEEGLAKVTHQTVGRYLDELEAGGTKLTRRRRRDPRKPRPPVVQTSVPDLPPPVVPPPVDGDADLDPVARLKKRLEQVGRMIEEAGANQNITTFAGLCRTEGQIAKDLEALKPPPTPDPEQDPMYVKARQRLMLRIRLLVRRQEDVRAEAAAG